MNRDRIEQEIGNCSEIISKATSLLSIQLRNAIYKNVGDYRQALRMQLYEQEVNDRAAERRSEIEMEISTPAD